MNAFDVSTSDPIPAGKKNLTYTLVYQATDRTLKDVEANELLRSWFVCCMRSLGLL
jgi:phenylalanyl-tRNA synthetase beta chain